MSPRQQRKAPLSKVVRQAKWRLAGLGWSYCAAAPELGVHWGHLAKILPDARQSRALLDRVRRLPPP